MMVAPLVLTLALFTLSAGFLLWAGFRRKRRLWAALGASLLLMTVPLGVKLYEAALKGALLDSKWELATLAISALGIGMLLTLLLDRERITRELELERSAATRLSQGFVELELAADAFRTSSMRYELAALGAHDGMWSLELPSGRMFFSARYAALLGLPATEVTFEDWLALIHSDDVAAVRNALEAHIAADSEMFECEHRIRHSDGRVLWVRSRGTARRDASGRAQQVAGSMSDITKRRMSDEYRARGHVEDRLTGLATRVVLLERITQSIARARGRTDYQFALLTIDMDRFKTINSGFGQRSGDELLVATARKLEACVAPGDLVARIGGDKFGVLLEDVGNVERVTTFADQVLNEIEAPVQVGQHQVCASGSIGIALSTMSYQDPDDVLRDADTALGRARELGRGCYQIFDTHLKSRIRDRIDLETELLRGVVEDQFRLVYQPIVSLTTGRIHGFEALVRWRHPRRGLIPPAEFIPIAEENGTIVLIGRWVLSRACHQVKRWRERFGTDLPLSINVNISACQFRHPRLVEDVVAVLEDAGIDAADLKLEITENVLMQNQDDVARVLSELKSHGIGLSIDDFGTGYSSLGYLSHFPVDTLKIDRSFVADLESKSESVELVKTILQLGKSLKLQVVAEGVETNEQLAKLRKLGCDFAQGFLFGQPADEPLATWLIEREIEALDVPLGRRTSASDAPSSQRSTPLPVDAAFQQLSQTKIEIITDAALQEPVNPGIPEVSQSTSPDAGPAQDPTETAKVSAKLKEAVLG